MDQKPDDQEPIVGNEPTAASSDSSEPAPVSEPAEAAPAPELPADDAAPASRAEDEVADEGDAGQPDSSTVMESGHEPAASRAEDEVADERDAGQSDTRAVTENGSEADADEAASEDEEEEEEPLEPIRFEDLALPDPLMRAIADLGFTEGTPIQSAVLPWSLSDYDIVGQAQTGTGKTAAFLITIFTRLWENPEDQPPPVGRPRNLVLAPTRELALQIARDAEELGRYTPFNILAVVGGIDFERQLSRLKSQPVDLVIATPGRLIDFIDRRAIDLRAVEVLVIDEADRMLDMGFIPDVRRIVYKTPHKRVRQTLFFSATFNDDVHRLADQWTIDPFKVEIEPESIAVDTVTQEMYTVAAEDKFKVLYNLIMDRELTRVIVFSNRRDSTREIYQRLRALGVDCDTLAGDIPQRKRLATLDRFKAGKTRVLVATDVAGRGIHVEGISHVINYELPEDPEDYVHRIGRTGRAGATGTSISLVCEDEAFKVDEIETLLGRKLDFMHPPERMLAPVPSRRGSRRRRGEAAGEADLEDGDEAPLERAETPEAPEAEAETEQRAAPATAGAMESEGDSETAEPVEDPSSDEDGEQAVHSNKAPDYVYEEDVDLDELDRRINGNVAVPEEEEPDDETIDSMINGNVASPQRANGSAPKPRRRRRRRRRGRPGGNGGNGAGNGGG